MNHRRLILSTLVLVQAAMACAPARRPPGSGDGTLITQEYIASRPGVPIEKIIQDRVPGIIVRRTSAGGLALQIRSSSAYKNSDDALPLYVLNDLPVGAGPDGSLPGIDPYDIESIKVLKGTEAAIYGLQGAAGVIVIKTRSASRPR
jgi:TonB-dependent SusC/RagA subfamily outer membrane receptor